MSTKVIIFLLFTLTTLLALCEAVNFCKMRIGRKCRFKGKRFDLYDDDDEDLNMNDLDVVQRRGNGGGEDGFYPVMSPDFWNRLHSAKHYSDVAKKSSNTDFIPTESILQLLLRKYYESQEKNNWEKLNSF